MTGEIILKSISTKVWDWAGMELVTPGSAVRLASVARHVTDCATRPGNINDIAKQLLRSTRLFVDDSSLLYAAEGLADISYTINYDLIMLRKNIGWLSLTHSKLKRSYLL